MTSCGCSSCLELAWSALSNIFSGAVSTCMCLNPLNFACFFLPKWQRRMPEDCQQTPAVCAPQARSLGLQRRWRNTRKILATVRNVTNSIAAALTLSVGRGPGGITSRGSEKHTEMGPSLPDGVGVMKGSFSMHISLQPRLWALLFFLKAAIITCKQGLNFDFYTCKVNSCRFVERQRFMAVSRS